MALKAQCRDGSANVGAATRCGEWTGGKRISSSPRGRRDQNLPLDAGGHAFTIYPRFEDDAGRSVLSSALRCGRMGCGKSEQAACWCHTAMFDHSSRFHVFPGRIPGRSPSTPILLGKVPTITLNGDRICTA